MVVLELMGWCRDSWKNGSEAELTYDGTDRSPIDFTSIVHKMGEDNKVYIIHSDGINEYFATYCHKERLIHLLINYTGSSAREQINVDILISKALREKQDIVGIFKFLGI